MAITEGARTRTIVWQDPSVTATRMREMTGLEFLRAITRGDLPPPPIGVLMDFRVVEVDEGRVVFEGVPAEYHYNPIGMVHGGFASTLLDSAMGCAIHSTLPAGVGYATQDIHVRFLRPITHETGLLRCEAQVVHVGRTVGTAEARLTDAAGKLYGQGTTACAVFRPTHS